MGFSPLGTTERTRAWRVVDGRGFIVDFYCHKASMVIEVDGDIHDLQKEEDALRE